MTLSVGLFIVIVIVAMMIGSCIGVFILAMCQISARSEERSEQVRSEFSEKE